MVRHSLWKHIALWGLLYLFWITIFQNHTLTFSRTITIEFCYLLFIAGNYYLHTKLTIPRLLHRKLYLSFGLAFLAGILVGAILRTLLALYMNAHFFLPGGKQPLFETVFLNSLLNIAVWVICLIAAWLLVERIRFRKYVDDMEKEKIKNELDFLKAQFNPHFLFNSINSIYGHIDRQNSTARNMLLSFSEMLRYQLYECNAERVLIDQEVHYLRNYVGLQQVRKEEDLIVSLTIGKDVKGFSIAPLLFIAFIENAFKYVSNYENKENRVEISLEKRGNLLLFRVFNTYEKHQGNPIEHQGIGIANVRRRLELLYPDKYDLQTLQEENCYEALLTLILS
jgi:two-component system LytT family sensor kinase